jgi:hypothetical protein
MSTIDRLAGPLLVVAAVVAFAYSLTFGAFVQEGYEAAQWASVVLLLVGGLLGLAVAVVLHRHLRAVDEGWSLLALVVAAFGTGASALHGAHDLAVLANPPGVTEFPNATDPRGFATFALAAAAIALWTVLLGRDGLARGVIGLRYVAAVLLVGVYIGRLTILDPKTWWLAAAALISGLVAVPGWYLAVARHLTRRSRDDQRPAHEGARRAH